MTIGLTTSRRELRMLWGDEEPCPSHRAGVVAKVPMIWLFIIGVGVIALIIGAEDEKQPDNRFSAKPRKPEPWPWEKDQDAERAKADESFEQWQQRKAPPTPEQCRAFLERRDRDAPKARPDAAEPDPRTVWGAPGHEDYMAGYAAGRAHAGASSEDGDADDVVDWEEPEFDDDGNDVSDHEGWCRKCGSYTWGDCDHA